jgi:hypothetical protein
VSDLLLDTGHACIGQPHRQAFSAITRAKSKPKFFILNYLHYGALQQSILPYVLSEQQLQLFLQ